jgi:hypothetical protein
MYTVCMYVSLYVCTILRVILTATVTQEGEHFFAENNKNKNSKFAISSIIHVILARSIMMISQSVLS